MLVWQLTLFVAVLVNGWSIGKDQCVSLVAESSSVSSIVPACINVTFTEGNLQNGHALIARLKDRSNWTFIEEATAATTTTTFFL